MNNQGKSVDKENTKDNKQSERVNKNILEEEAGGQYMENEQGNLGCLPKPQGLTRKAVRRLPAAEQSGSTKEEVKKPVLKREKNKKKGNNRGTRKSSRISNKCIGEGFTNTIDTPLSLTDSENEKTASDNEDVSDDGEDGDAVAPDTGDDESTDEGNSEGDSVDDIEQREVKKQKKGEVTTDVGDTGTGEASVGVETGRNVDMEINDGGNDVHETDQEIRETVDNMVADDVHMDKSDGGNNVHDTDQVEEEPEEMGAIRKGGHDKGQSSRCEQGKGHGNTKRVLRSANKGKNKAGASSGKADMDVNMDAGEGDMAGVKEQARRGGKKVEKVAAGKRKQRKAKNDSGKEAGSGDEGKEGKRGKKECMRIRTSPKSLLAAIRCISKGQKKCVKEMGFGSLLKFCIDEIPSKLVYFVVRSTDYFMKIKLEKGVISLDVPAVHDMLGLPIGGVQLDTIENMPNNDDIMDDWWEQFGGKENVPSPAEIKRQIVFSNEADWNFKLNFIALVANTLAACTARGSADLKVLKYITSETYIAGIDWSRFIWLAAKKSRNAVAVTKGIPKYFNGPATLFALMYVDYTKSNVKPFDRVRPAHYGWNYELLRNRSNVELESGGFGKLDVIGIMRTGEHHEEENDGDNDDSGFLSEPDQTEEYVMELKKIHKKVEKYEKLLQKVCNEAFAKYPEDGDICKWKNMVDVKVGGGDKSDSINQPCEFDTPIKGVSSNEFGKGKCSKGKGNEEKESFEREARRAAAAAKLQKETGTMDGPSFSFGLTQEFDDGLDNASVNPNLKTPEPNPPMAKEGAELGKREGKVADTRKSPYYERTIDIGNRVPTSEGVLWRYIITVKDSDDEIVFGTVTERQSVMWSVKTLANDGWINVDIIDSWAEMLNLDEKYQSKSSPYRLFCHCGMMTTDMISGKLDGEERLKLFEVNLREVLHGDDEKMRLRDYELVFSRF